MERPQQFRDPQLETSGDIIGFYPREFYPFDNFASFQVDYAGRRWPTSEHAYQASHFFDTDPELVEAIAEARSAHDAYKLAKANGDKAPENWDDIKVDVMYGICKEKMLQNPYVLVKLLASGDLDIVEDSTKDAFWGWGPNRDGRNELGKIWMKLRDQLRSGDISTDTSV
jgi:N-glycosidase YbiA